MTKIVNSREQDYISREHNNMRFTTRLTYENIVHFVHSSGSIGGHETILSFIARTCIKNAQMTLTGYNNGAD